MTDQSGRKESPPAKVKTGSKAEDERTNKQILLEEIGQKLSQARQQREEDIDAIVLKLKYQKTQLQALESGNWEGLPDEVYAVGFLRQYAAHLKLDLSDEIYRLKNRQYALTKPLTFPDPPVAPSRKWAWIFGSVFIALFVYFNVMNQDGKLPGAKPASPPALHPDAPDNQPPAVLNMDQPAASPAEKEISPVASENSEAADLTLEPKIEAVQPLPASRSTHHYIFKAATDAVWLQIYLPDKTGNKKGRLYKEALLKKGHQLEVKEAVKSLWITCGRPLALEVSADGKILYEAGSFGVVGKVMRNFHLGLANGR
jgi:hypothetical protein